MTTDIDSKGEEVNDGESVKLNDCRQSEDRL